MPKGTNKFYARDKLEIAQRVSKLLGPEGLKTQFIGDYVADAQQFVRDNNIMPSDEVNTGSVLHVAGGQGDEFARIYYDGKQEVIDRETYVKESMYNFLPARFKTYTPSV